MISAKKHQNWGFMALTRIAELTNLWMGLYEYLIFNTPVCPCQTHWGIAYHCLPNYAVLKSQRQTERSHSGTLEKKLFLEKPLSSLARNIQSASTAVLTCTY